MREGRGRRSRAGVVFQQPVSAQGKIADQLVRIAVAASGKQARISITDTKLLTVDQLVRIAVAGKGCVFFEEVE